MAHQAEDVDRLRFHPRVAVHNGLGTGKTNTVAWWLQDLWARGVVDEVLLVGPGILCHNWRDALCGGAWAEGVVDFVDARPPDHWAFAEAMAAQAVPRPGGMAAHFTSYAGARDLVFGGESSRGRAPESDLLRRLAGARVALVVDEAHGAALPDTDQARACRALADRCVAVAEVTATPVGRWEHLRLWGLARLVRPDVVRARSGVQVSKEPAPPAGTFDAFKTRYARLRDPMEGKRGSFRVSRAYAVGVNVGRVREEVMAPMAPYTARRAKEDCLDLPPKVRMLRLYDAPAEVSRLMLDLLEDDRAVLADGHAVTPANILEERLRCLELTGGWLGGRPVHHAKLDLLREVLAEVEEGSPGPLCLWASRTRELLACALAAGGVAPGEAQARASAACPSDGEVVQAEYTSCVELAARGGVGLIHGPTPEGRRESIQAAWRAGDLRAVVAHPGVAGAGLNWQHVVTTVYYSQPLGTIARQQSEDRVHRHGLRHAAVYYDLCMAAGPDLAAARAHAAQRDAELEVLAWLARTIAECSRGDAPQR